jgi:murein DD-endopeptidase MepM/ murein hydrolase activator NlpD
VTTIAGNGQAGYVDGKALQAQLNGPIGVALDKLGQVYVADTYNDKIRMINNQGEVVTVAGSSTGYMDGTALEAQFNTPTGIVINRANEIIVADSYNHAIRKITDQGMVATIAMSERKDSTAIMFKPIGLAITHDDYIYVGESSNGRILQISPLDQLIGLTGVDIDIIPGDDTSIRLKKPFGIAVDQNGELLITDNDQLLILRLRKNTQVAKQQSKISISEFNKPESVKEKSPQLWPLLPQNQVHEVVGTIGEVRGNYQGESRDHFHRGLDIQADMGKSVVVIMDEKVKDPIATWSANTINEGIRLGTMAYIHMKVGRDAKNQNIDSNKFKMKLNPKGQIQQVQVKRGTRFRTGDVIGMVNSMYHVHLNYYVKGDVLNPLVLGFVGFEDNVEPLIFGIEVRDQYDQLLKKLKNKNILTIPRSLEKISIIVDAADQTDGNAARRRLGLYELSYQVLYEDGKPIEGFESPRNTIRFNQLPVDDEAVMVVYASNSGITVHGSARTRFLYNITNEVRNGHAIKGFLDIKNLPLGDYIIRVTVSDYAGNVAKTNRDLPIRIE